MPRQLGFDVSAFGLGAEGSLTVKREVRQELSFDLPGGYGYQLFGLRYVDGFAWKVKPAYAGELKAA